MRILLNSFSKFSLVLVLCFVLASCGGGFDTSGEGSFSSPPVEIPVPVTSLMRLSSPDALGTVKLVGAKGAVPPASGVRVSEASDTAQHFWRSFKKLFLASAWAQSILGIGAADTEGFFELFFPASIGQTVEVVSLNQGIPGAPVHLTVPEGVLSLPALPQAFDLALGRLWLSAQAEDSSQLFGFNLSNELFSNPPSFLDFPNLSGLEDWEVSPDGTQGFGISQDNASITFVNLMNADNFVKPLSAPLDLEYLESADLLFTGTGSNLLSINVYDVLADLFLCNIALPHPLLLLDHERTPLIRVLEDSAGNVQLIAYSEFSGGRRVLSFIEFVACGLHTVTQQLDLPDNMEAKEMVLTDPVDGRRVAISDTSSDQVILVNRDDASLTSIATGATPFGMDYEATANRLWVVEQSSNSILRVNLNDLSQDRLDLIGLAPTKILVDEASGKFFVLSSIDRSLIILDI